MSTADRVLALKLITDVGDMNKQMKGVQGRFKGMVSGARQWSRAFTSAFVVQGIEAVGDALKDGIEGYKSGRIVADQLGKTWRNLGLDGRALEATLQKVTDSTLKLGTSDDEAVAAFTQSIKMTKDYGTSLEHLQIAQDLVANGSAPNLESAFRIIQQASRGSARVVDRFGLTSQTAGGRVKELGKQVKGAAKRKADLEPMAVAMNRIGEAMETIAGAAIIPALDEAGKVMADVVAPAIEDVAAAVGENGELAGKLVVLGGAIALLGTVALAHPLLALAFAITAVSAAAAVAIQNDWLGQLATSAEDTRTRIAAAEPVGPLQRALLALDGLIKAIAEPVSGWLDNVATAWRGAGEILSGDLSGLMGTLISTVQAGMGLLLLPFQVVWGVIKAGFDQLGVDIDGIVGSIRDTIVGHLRNAVRLAIQLWNSIDIEVPGFTLSWPRQGFELNGPWGSTFVGFDAGSFKFWDRNPDLFPDINSWGGVGTGGAGGAAGGVKPKQFTDKKGRVTGVGYADGLWDVPADDLAFVHRGESIVPADFAERLRQTGTLTGAGRPTTVVNHITINAGVGSDPIAIGREMDRYLSRYYAASGGVRTR